VNARGLDPLGADLTQNDTAGLAVAKEKYRRENALRIEATLGELADGTGGAFYNNTNDLIEGFRRLDSRPEYIYILGFSPQDLKRDGKYHAMRVTVRDSSTYQLQIRHGYYAPKRAATTAEHTSEELRDVLYSRDELCDIPVEVDLQALKSGVNIVTRIDVRTLPYQKIAGRNTDTLVIVAGVFDQNGALVDSFQKSLAMKLKDQTLASPGASGIGVKAAFTLKLGKYLVRLVVRDSHSGMVASLNRDVEIPQS
jgi:hypothetical protein